MPKRGARVPRVVSPEVDLLPETFWAYLAGLIDGEGTIGVYIRSKGRGTRQKTPKTYYGGRISIVNTSEEVMEFLKITLGDYVYTKSKAKRNRKKAYVWGTYNPILVAKICSRCLPYLVIKKKQAELVLSYPGSANNQWSPEYIKKLDELKLSLYLQTRELNGRHYAMDAE